MTPRKTTTKTETPTPAPSADIAQIEISEIAAETLRVPILGTAPLIMHRFSEKAKRIMLDRMQGRTSPKEPRDPEAEYQASLYLLKEDQPGFPVVAFKAATVDGARFYSGVTMTALRQSMFMSGEIGVGGDMMCRIDGEHHMREDVVRIQRTTDLRYRAEFTEWSTTLDVTFVQSMLTRGSVLSLIDAGGLGVGVGEWRPEKGGTFGTFRIDPTRKVEVITR